MNRCAALAVLATGCGSPRPAPSSAPARQPAAVPQAAPQAQKEPASGSEPEKEPSPETPPTGPVLVPVEGDPAPWLEAPLAAGKSANAPTYRTEVVAVGSKAAIVKTAAGEHLAFHADRGALGPLALPPDTEWLGLGRNDRVFAADQGGAVHVAADLKDALPGGNWDARSSVSGAVAWDVAPGWLVATDGRFVYVSTDGARRFSRSNPPGGSIARVFARSDGALVAVVRRGERLAPYVSANGGRRWRAARLRPKKLVRDGPWIWNGSWSCPAVLSQDPGRWARPSRALFHKKLNTRSWSAHLQTADRIDGVAGYADWESHAYPPLPPRPAGKAHIRGRSACRSRKGGEAGGVEGGVLGGVLSGRSQCLHAECLRSDPAPRPPATRSHIAFFRDAACRASDADKYGACKRGAALTRKPKVALGDRARGTVRVGRVPERCEPARILTARGLAILLCREGDGTAVWAADRGGAWSREHQSRRSPEDFWNHSVASDGTLLLQLSCGREARSCEALVRRPRAIGDGEAWFDVSVEGAMTHRPVPGGAALLALAGDGGLGLALARSATEVEVLTSGVEGDGRPYRLAIEADGKVRIDQRDSPSAADAYYVGYGGATHPADSPEPRRTKDGVLLVDPVPVDPEGVPPSRGKLD